MERFLILGRGGVEFGWGRGYGGLVGRMAAMSNLRNIVIASTILACLLVFIWAIIYSRNTQIGESASSGSNERIDSENHIDSAISKDDGIVLHTEPPGLLLDERSNQFIEKELVDFIENNLGSEHNPIIPWYSVVRDTLYSQHAPMLRSLLVSSDYQNRSPALAQMLLLICEKSDKESLDVVMNYIRSDVPPTGLDNEQTWSFYIRKMKTLELVGLLDPDIATSILSQAFTEQGGESLVHAWKLRFPRTGSTNPIYADPSAEIVEWARTSAAQGLILTQIEENRRIVRAGVESDIHRYLSDEYRAARESLTTTELELDIKRYLGAAGALASDEVIADVGFEAYFEDMQWGKLLHKSMKYYDKYSDVVREQTWKNVDSCPICNKSRTELNMIG